MTDPRITRIAARTQALADAETVIGVLFGKEGQSTQAERITAARAVRAKLDKPDKAVSR